MNYADEQTNEIEALESIYYDEFTIQETSPYHKFSITIKSEEYEPGTEDGLGCCLEFTYTEKYPEEPLIVVIEDEQNFREGDKEKLAACIEEQIQSNLGTVVVFTLVSVAQEWLNDQWDIIKLARKEKADQKLIEEEEAERKRFEGTRVTVETFLRWKKTFEMEMGITKRKEQAEKEGKKLTGRELFMTDKTLNQSDLKFLDDENVKIDESLFQNLSELELEDDEDEYDPDYDPDNSENSD